MAAPLDERAVQRFARQILLREVGGRGQAALQAAPVALQGRQPALEVAGAYLAAGGTPVDGARGALPFDPIALPSAGSLVCAPALPSSLPAVVLGERAVLGASATACRACLALTVGGWSAPARPALLGTLGALMWQRLALGLAAPLEVRVLVGELSVEPGEVVRCPEHARA